MEDKPLPTDNKISKTTQHLAIWWPPIILAFGILLFYLTSLNYYTLPSPKIENDMVKLLDFVTAITCLT